ncbi:MAG: hypothetical protein KGH74_05600 [Candidatus Micrarchaeota archaeon]|nr:hypothetical protein [Candidatus Micrarchaeota archaeon]
MAIVLVIAGSAVWALNTPPPPPQIPFSYPYNGSCFTVNQGGHVMGAVNIGNGTC